MKTLTSLLILLTFSNFYAQLPYTTSLYGFEIITDVEYGTSPNYAGTDTQLLLDIYKPTGDQNCNRPIMILVHGGAWVTDSKENASMQYMAEELAKRGWVVANIDYRLGTNKAPTYSANGLICNNITEPCAYNSDSLEMIRANYRAMQDAKGVVRYMKSRYLMDSTNINAVFMAGESAGGFISLSTGFTNDISKKPAACFAQTDAPTPAPDLAALPCSDPNNDLYRPDLEGINGTLHVGNYDASLLGVGSFFGGVIDLSVFDNIAHPPSVYLFAQGSDAIIHYDYGVMFERMSSCLNGICPDYGPYPNAYGSEGIRKHFVSLGGAAPDYKADIVNNFNANGNCFGNGHQIDDADLRIQSMVDFFAQKIGASANIPNGTDTRTECNSYTWIDGINYTASNNTATYNILGGSVNGCDSLVSLDLTIVNYTTGTDTRTECNSYTWIDGINYTTSNNTATYNIVGGSVSGCDSLVYLDLTIFNYTTGTDTRTECNSYTWIDGINYTTSNNTATYNIVGGSVNGCDSLVSLDLTINMVNLSVTLTGSLLIADETGATYQWLNCPGLTPISGATNQSYTATSIGDYAVIVTQNGCSDTSACYTVNSVGIMMNDFGNKLLLYPNPTNGNFSIDLGKKYQAITVTMTDLSGKVIHSKTYNNSQLLNFKLEEPAGIYLLNIESVNNKAVIRLIKE